ncbi:putative serine protease PepD [Sinomonas atrocyanea]|uniref:S1C family serine protease n=1 Tax=Sinomonas atrocyanea TaxID=37927 RepID=UPI00278028EF|nr:trypsin-like peptidase domain-containing protein [Sinomonas atrocyanea]MDP9885422.1 putative serine protease PepD [Sinomonas atrocyanea]
MNESDPRPAQSGSGAPDPRDHADAPGQPAVPPAGAPGTGQGAQHAQGPAPQQPTQPQQRPQAGRDQPTQPIPPYGQPGHGQGQQGPQYGQQGPQYGQRAPQYGQQGPQQGPQYGQQAPQYGQRAPLYGPPQGPAPYGQPQYGQQGHPGNSGNSFFRPANQRQGQKARWGTGVLVGGMLVAGLVGGGVAAGTAGLWAPHLTSSASQSQDSSPVIVNNQDSVNAVTAAAAKASPSVVTIGVSSGNSSGTGSGVVLDNQGHILTNTHVVTLDGQVSNPTIEVRANNGSVYKASVVGTDPLSDLAVVKVDGANLTPVTFGDSGKLNVGDIAVAIGAPLGLDSTVTDGIVSNLNRTISVQSSAAPNGGDNSQDNGGQGFQFAPPGGGQTQRQSPQSTVSLNVIQTDAAINPGNSGGALVNSQGQLIGINVAIASTGSGSGTGSESGNIGVGFSIPANYAHRIANELIANGKATHGQLGVSVQSQSASGTSSAFSTGAQVVSVTSGSAADKAGIHQGDVITKFAGRPIGDASELTAAVHEQAPGSTAKVTVLRNGQSQDLDVTVGAAK